MTENDRLEGKYDVAVIGGGPAGLFAGIFAAKRGLSVLVLEKERILLKKLLITGKGRCNVTNACDKETFFANLRCGERFMQSAYSSFGTAEIMEFFENAGVELVTERGNRVFPKSGNSQDIADALLKAARDAGCRIENKTAVSIETENGEVTGVGFADRTHVCCRAAVIATGGLSYPRTGSTGDGYAMAKKLGINVTATAPSLVPIECDGPDCREMMGLSLKNVRLSAEYRGKKIYSDIGEMLFAHFGISGPLVLSMSGMLVGKDIHEVHAEIDLKPALDEQTLDRRLLRDFQKNTNREFKNSLGELLPQKMIPIIVRRSEIAPEQKINSITVKQRAALAAAMKHFALTMKKTRPIDEAVVTAGGVDCKELDPKTMMSKKIKNLHFAGEVMDVDGYTGGFNLTVAFSTGYAVGKSILGGK
ncbi:MAG: NAD(P)/FAD-dependent oxidoreductase [Oscillospiraceae bacterium]